MKRYTDVHYVLYPTVCNTYEVAKQFQYFKKQKPDSACNMTPAVSRDTSAITGGATLLYRKCDNAIVASMLNEHCESLRRLYF